MPYFIQNATDTDINTSDNSLMNINSHTFLHILLNLTLQMYNFADNANILTHTSHISLNLMCSKLSTQNIDI